MYSSNIETLFHSHSLRVEYIFNLVLNSVMKTFIKNTMAHIYQTFQTRKADLKSSLN